MVRRDPPFKFYDENISKSYLVPPRIRPTITRSENSTAEKWAAKNFVCISF